MAVRNPEDKTTGHVFNILDYGAVYSGLGTSDAAIQAATNDLLAVIAAGGDGAVLIPGHFDVAGTITVPLNTPVTYCGFGMGRPLTGGSRLRRTGALPIVSAVGTGNTDATRATINLHDLMLDGNGAAGVVLRLQRVNDCTLRNVRVGFSAGTGVQFTQVWNSEVDTLRVHNCGNGAGTPAVLFDGAAGVGGQGGSDTVNCSNWQLEGNNGTPLRLTGSVADAAPSTTVEMVNLKIEGSGGAWPQIDLDYAQDCAFTNVHISNVDTSTVALIRQTGTTSGARANQFENLVVDTTAPVPYFVDHTVGALSIANVNFIGAGAGFVAFVRVGNGVGAGDFSLVGATTNSPGHLVDDQRAVKGRWERLRGQKVWDPPSIATGATTSTTVPVTGAQLATADVASAALDHVVPAGCFLAASVTANDTVTVTLANFSGAAVDIPSSALVVDVMH